MSPEEQERFLSNNQRFQSLSPERQALIRERLRQWNSLAPEQQRALRERQEVWGRLSPEQQQQVRAEILPKWRQLDPGRRLELRHRLAELAGLSEQERAAKLSDEAFLQGLSPQERKLLGDLSALRLSPPAERPGP